MTAKDPTQPISILFWSEPNPFRNSYTEHLHVARALLPPLVKAVSSGDALLRLFSNNDMIDRLIIDLPESVSVLQRPTNDEAHAIAGQFGLWNDSTIGNWLDLVRGKGDITAIYVNILERLHAEQPIDVILTWSENGAVRNFAKAHGIPVLFGEMGPTRAPFPQTMYFDPEGTNGHAAYRRRIRAMIEAAEPGSFLPASTWLVPNERSNPQQETGASLVDIGLTYRPDDVAILPDQPYFFVPLQLADDLNTLLHSEFSGPVDFLRHVSELARKGGYAMVVKGHPGAKDRPYNMRREIEALDWLEQNVPEALILPRDCGPNLSAYAIANAAYTVSINSSVGFESMILGVPPLVLGQAAFDANGWLQENIPLLPADVPRNFGPQLDALVSAYMEHVLVPRDIALEGDYLLHRLRALVAGGRDQPLENFSHSDWHVVDSLRVGGKAPRRLPRMSALGKWKIEAQAQLTLASDMAIFTDARQTLEQIVPLREEFTGFIDIVTEDGPERFRIAAWALDSKTMRPPLMVLLLEGDKVKSRHRVTVKRPDVHAVFPELAATPTCGFQFGFSAKNLSDIRLMLVAHDGTGQFLPQVGPGIPIISRQVQTPAATEAMAEGIG